MANLYIPNVISRTTKSVDWMFDRDQEAADDAAAAILDKRLDIEDHVTFAELVEEIADFNEARADEFMKSLRMYTRGMPTMYALIDQAFERIVDRKMKEQS